MRKKSKLMVLVVFALVVGLIGCGYNKKDLIVIKEDNYKANYDKMFDVALKTGVQLGYKPVYQDKNSGMISMEKDTTGLMDILKIIINFGDVKGGKGFEISGVASSGAIPVGADNDFIAIKNAILQAAGLP